MRPFSSSKIFDSLAKKRMALPVALCAALLVFAAVPACSSDTQAPETSQEQTAPAAQEAATGTLFLRIDIEGWDASRGDISVNVTGESQNDEKIDETVRVTPGKDTELAYTAGSYTFSVSADDLSDDAIVYESGILGVTFDGTQDQTAVLEISQDVEATEAIAQQKAEKEARAQAEAEEAARAQAEAEAAAQAEAEAEARRQSEQAPSIQTNEQTVYITKTGEKYHNSGCSSLRKSKIPISLSDAEARGYTPCKNCH